jgi:hypothetical protein
MRPQDADSVENLLSRQILVIADATGDDRHVVLACELLAKLREQVCGRLDPRLVVLVEDEESGPAVHAG